MKCELRCPQPLISAPPFLIKKEALASFYLIHFVSGKYELSWVSFWKYIALASLYFNLSFNTRHVCFSLCRDGRLRESDQILAIDSQLLDSNIPHQQAIRILQKASGLVELVVARGPIPQTGQTTPAPTTGGSENLEMVVSTLYSSILLSWRVLPRRGATSRNIELINIFIVPCPFQSWFKPRNIVDLF